MHHLKFEKYVILKKNKRPVITRKPTQKPEYLNDTVELYILNTLEKIKQHNLFLSTDLPDTHIAYISIKVQNEYGLFTFNKHRKDYIITFENHAANMEDEEFIEWKLVEK